MCSGVSSYVRFVIQVKVIIIILMVIITIEMVIIELDMASYRPFLHPDALGCIPSVPMCNPNLKKMYATSEELIKQPGQLSKIIYNPSKGNKIHQQPH